MASKILPQFSQGFCSHQWDNFYSNILVYLKGVVYILYTPACSGTCSCLEGYLILLQCLYGFFFLLEGVLNPAYMGFSSCLAGYLLLIWVILTVLLLGGVLTPAWRGTYSCLEGYLLLLGGVLDPALSDTYSCLEGYLMVSTDGSLSPLTTEVPEVPWLECRLDCLKGTLNDCHNSSVKFHTARKICHSLEIKCRVIYR